MTSRIAEQISEIRHLCSKAEIQMEADNDLKAGHTMDEIIAEAQKASKIITEEDVPND